MNYQDVSISYKAYINMPYNIIYLTYNIDRSKYKMTRLCHILHMLFCIVNYIGFRNKIRICPGSITLLPLANATDVVP